MKFNKFFLAIALGTMVLSCSQGNKEMDVEDIENSNPENAPKKVGAGEVKFLDTLKEFGKITDGEIVEHTYRFRNTGKVPVAISKVEASCGCTTPDYTKEIIPPGGEGKVKATFNSSGYGYPEAPKVEKSISVYFDDCKTDLVVLKFTANIYAPAKEGENSNTSGGHDH